MSFFMLFASRPLKRLENENGGQGSAIASRAIRENRRG
jgi:hypothetical protein